jgi:hypothetical protein
MQVLEELVRGNSLKEMSAGTEYFAISFMRTMKSYDCLGESNELYMEKLRSTFLDEVIDVRILCSALGKKMFEQAVIDEFNKSQFIEME